MELRKRKSNRLKDYDYSETGAYFVTICVKEKHCILSTIVGDGVLDVPGKSSNLSGISRAEVLLTDIGAIIQNQLEEMRQTYDHILIDSYVIMPNHIHLLLSLREQAPAGDSGTSRTPSPTNASIPSFVSCLKRFTNKKAGFDIWQRSYHDHIIRSEEDDWLHRQYIEQNPQRWAEDEYHYQ